MADQAPLTFEVIGGGKRKIVKGRTAHLIDWMMHFEESLNDKQFIATLNLNLFTKDDTPRFGVVQHVTIMPITE